MNQYELTQDIARYSAESDRLIDAMMDNTDPTKDVPLREQFHQARLIANAIKALKDMQKDLNI